MAKECINSQKAINRLHMQKAHFLDMECALKEQLGAHAALHSRRPSLLPAMSCVMVTTV